MGMDGSELRQILDNKETDWAREEKLADLTDEKLSEVLSRILINFEFDSWQYDVLNEACKRLDGSTDPDMPPDPMGDD